MSRETITKADVFYLSTLAQNSVSHAFSDHLKLPPCPTQLQSAGGLQPLVNLLHSHHKEVLQNVCLAISACATDEPTAVEMCRFG